ncbi:hypothetical protein U9M48_019206 [Paspalum notatum var. saurae]|uniref:Uncharacterized protein n=1 Tax=Paspalum notatum var. saurae TaxID=547442 RepID=A0AAQ3TF63_PASNO
MSQGLYPFLDAPPKHVFGATRPTFDCWHSRIPIVKHIVSRNNLPCLVFQKFREFQNLVECLVNRKIIIVLTDWGGEEENIKSSTIVLQSRNISSCFLPLCSAVKWIN